MQMLFYSLNQTLSCLFVCLFVYSGDVTIAVAVVVSKEIPNT